MIRDTPSVLVLPPPFGVPTEQQQNEALVPCRRPWLVIGNRSTGGERLVESPETNQRLAKIGVHISEPVRIGISRGMHQSGTETRNRLLKPIQRRQRTAEIEVRRRIAAVGRQHLTVARDRFGVAPAAGERVAQIGESRWIAGP